MAKDLEDNGWPRERSPDLLVSHPLGSVVLLKSSRVDPEREKKEPSIWDLKRLRRERQPSEYDIVAAVATGKTRDSLVLTV